MKPGLFLAMFLTVGTAVAQRSAETPRANQGRVPAAPARRAVKERPEAEHVAPGRVNNTPHVANDKWYGHDAPNDKRFQLSKPFAHGHFERFGPTNRYSIERFDASLHRFWLSGGFYFEIAPWDWVMAQGWCWTCTGDDFVVYEDTDHLGWYLLYNVHTGLYLHAQYMGI